MASKLEAAAKRLCEVAALAAQELTQAETMLDETKKKLQAEHRMRTEIVADCKALAL